MTSFINDRARFPAATTAAVKAYAKSKPWQGTEDERVAKLQTLHDALCAAHEIEVSLAIGILDGSPSIASHLRRVEPGTPLVLTMIGKLSVVTYLNLFGCAVAEDIGSNDRMFGFKYSQNLFKRFFPRSYESAVKAGPFLLRASDADNAGEVLGGE